jgi:hypothetical protein
LRGEYQSGQLGQTVNLLSYDFIGSNPISPTDPNSEFKIPDCGLNPGFGIRNLESGIDYAGVAQLVERQPSKLQVAGSNLVSRSIGALGIRH